MPATPKTTPWPYPDIVRMTAHAPSGQWRKRHGGRDYYFGSLSDPDGALARWRVEWPRITRGLPREAVRPADGSLTVQQMCEQFLQTKLAQHRRHELAWPSFVEYRYTAKKLTNCWGLRRAVSTLNPVDFLDLLNAVAHLGPEARKGVVTKTRGIFRWAWEHRLTPEPVNHGPDFRPPPAKARRLAKRQAGERMFEAKQIHQVLKLADPQMRALILLGINGGFGNNDAAQLPVSAVDLRGGWLQYDRTKTESYRRVPLWQATVRAIKVIAPGDGLLFLNQRGQPFVRRGTNEISKRMTELLDAAGIAGRGFYDLRRTFATVAAEESDTHASKIIMGHVVEGVHEGYVQRFPDERLLKVTNHVHAWLYPQGKRKQS